MLQDFLSSRPALATDRTPAASGTPRSAQFQPLSTSRVTELDAPTSPSAEENQRLESPLVEVLEVEGKVRRIVVTCTCCQKIEIECEY